MGQEGVSREELELADRVIGEAERERLPFRIGTGRAVSHHGEFTQGPLYAPALGGKTKPFVTALMTVLRNDRFSAAAFQPSARPDIVVKPEYAKKSSAAAKRVLELAGLPELGGYLLIRDNIGTVGAGQGSTTSNCLAAMRAAAKAVGLDLSHAVAQVLAWLAEGASDPVSLIERDGRQVVYASRIGRLIRQLAKPTPEGLFLGFNSDLGREVITENLIGEEAYTLEEASTFEEILNAACQAVEAGSIERLAEASTASAELNQHRLPTRGWRELKNVAAAVGALGISLSHSGTVGALIFGAEAGHRRLDDTIGILDRVLGYGGLEVFCT